MKKVITFSNMKGGTGKSIICAFFANYLKYLGYNVAVLDADIQQTIFRHRLRDLKALPPQEDGKEFEPPYEILALDTTNLDVVKAVMDNLDDFDGVVLIDCPGNAVDPALEYIYQRADIAVVPTHYNADNLDATMLFTEGFKSISEAKLVFIPNNIVISEDRRAEIAESRENAKKLLEKEGIFTPRIKHSVKIECYSTIFPMEYWQRNFVKYAFDPIVELINA